MADKKSIILFFFGFEMIILDSRKRDAIFFFFFLYLSANKRHNMLKKCHNVSSSNDKATRIISTYLEKKEKNNFIGLGDTY